MTISTAVSRSPPWRTYSRSYCQRKASLRDRNGPIRDNTLRASVRERMQFYRLKVKKDPEKPVPPEQPQPSRRRILPAGRVFAACRCHSSEADPRGLRGSISTFRKKGDTSHLDALPGRRISRGVGVPESGVETECAGRIAVTTVESACTPSDCASSPAESHCFINTTSSRVTSG